MFLVPDGTAVRVVFVKVMVCASVESSVTVFPLGLTVFVADWSEVSVRVFVGDTVSLSENDRVAATVEVKDCVLRGDAVDVFVSVCVCVVVSVACGVGDRNVGEIDQEMELEAVCVELNVAESSDVTEKVAVPPEGDAVAVMNSVTDFDSVPEADCDGVPVTVRLSDGLAECSILELPREALNVPVRDAETSDEVETLPLSDTDPERCIVILDRDSEKVMVLETDLD